MGTAGEGRCSSRTRPLALVLGPSVLFGRVGRGMLHGAVLTEDPAVPAASLALAQLAAAMTSHGPTVHPPVGRRGERSPEHRQASRSTTGRVMLGL
jgi:hypothetical protein